MDARKALGRSALPTPDAAQSNTRDPSCIPDAANAQPAADVFVGRAVRALRRVVELRLQDAKPARCLSELARAIDALSSAQWALEYEAGGWGQR
jgi:hypothetical protein